MIPYINLSNNPSTFTIPTIEVSPTPITPRSTWIKCKCANIFPSMIETNQKQQNNHRNNRSN